MRSLRRRFVLLGAIICVSVVGCGSNSDTNPVRGKITIKGGGPVSQGTITFTDVKGLSSSSGRINEDGSYSLTTLEEDDGAPAGEYKVAISAIEITEDPDAPAPTGDEVEGEGEEAKFLIDPKYANPATSGLTATVKEGSNDINFEVDPPPSN